ncbi:MAG: hypothetical protein JSV86_20155 [Gemmatimonadota bacterium]|nr:MAG: hypothetical protein JSV86_20155 [Gemmatimonadota bacterium]
MLYPWDLPPDFDYDRYFFKNRAWFFGLFIAAWLIDLVETTLKAGIRLRGLPQAYLLFIPSTVALSLAGAGALTSTRRLQGFFAVLFSTLARIAA